MRTAINSTVRNVKQSPNRLCAWITNTCEYLHPLAVLLFTEAVSLQPGAVRNPQGHGSRASSCLRVEVSCFHYVYNKWRIAVPASWLRWWKVGMTCFGRYTGPVSVGTATAQVTSICPRGTRRDMNLKYVTTSLHFTVHSHISYFHLIRC
jgi:hypothetical protein